MTKKEFLAYQKRVDPTMSIAAMEELWSDLVQRGPTRVTYTRVPSNHADPENTDASLPNKFVKTEKVEVCINGYVHHYIFYPETGQVPE